MTARSRRHGWPSTAAELVEVQRELAVVEPPSWELERALPAGPITVAGCYVCFSRGRSGRGDTGELGWAAACLVVAGGGAASTAVHQDVAGAPYEPGLLALREGPLLEGAVRALARRPDVVMVNATGRDHPRRAGLALQLGAVLGIPTVGVTDRSLLATGPDPGPSRGDTVALVLDGEVVGYRVRTRRGTRPVVAHAAWQTSPATAAGVVLHATGRWRTPEPLRLAREAARSARSAWSDAQ